MAWSYCRNIWRVSLSEQFMALYSYASNETGDLTFNQGDMIAVSKQDGDWWTGSIGDHSGIFPANYVRKMVCFSWSSSSLFN